MRKWLMMTEKSRDKKSGIVVNGMAFSTQRVWRKFCARVADKASGNELSEPICAPIHGELGGRIFRCAIVLIPPDTLSPAVNPSCPRPWPAKLGNAIDQPEEAIESFRDRLCKECPSRV